MFDLKRPCKLCPFVDGPDRITFACRERAVEIEEIAYRQGFVCHEHAECVEEDESMFGESYYDWKSDGRSQHCIGALWMYLQNGSGNVPWEMAVAHDSDFDEERWWNRADMSALASVFESEEAFIEANSNDDDT